MLPDHWSFGTSIARSNERVLNQLETHRVLQKRLLAIQMRGRHSVFMSAKTRIARTLMQRQTTVLLPRTSGVTHVVQRRLLTVTELACN